MHKITQNELHALGVATSDTKPALKAVRLLDGVADATDGYLVLALECVSDPKSEPAYVEGATAEALSPAKDEVFINEKGLFWVNGDEQPTGVCGEGMPDRKQIAKVLPKPGAEKGTVHLGIPVLAKIVAIADALGADKLALAFHGELEPFTARLWVGSELHTAKITAMPCKV